MKTTQFALIFVLAATTTFACSDEEDRAPATAGSSGAAGKDGAAGGDGTAGNNGTAGSSAAAGTGSSTAGTSGGTTDAGAGAVGGANEGGLGGAGGDGEGGLDGLGGAVGTAGEGGLGGVGGESGEGGALVVPDVLVNGPVELIGSWKDPEWGGVEVITETSWNGSNIVGYDSDSRAVYTHNSASSFYPGKYSKYVFTAPTNDSFYFCTILYASPSLEAAKADPKVVDASKLEDEGCNGFDWTKVVKQP